MIRYYITALRLRTLPLSISGVVVGSMLACSDGYFSFPVFFLAVCTTLSLQILSNISNDLGDAQKGVDSDESFGPASSLQLGGLTEKDYYGMIRFFMILCMLFGTLLVYFAFDSLFELRSFMFIALGVLAMIAAVKYTMGDDNYGYKGFGDLSVFLFFGLLSTIGGYYLHSGSMNPLILLPAAAMGFLIVGVLNVNNIRDITGDKLCGKNTVPVKIGMKKAKIYHYTLISGAWLCFIAYTILHGGSVWNYLYMVLIPLYGKHIIGVKNKEGQELDPELKALCMDIILLALVFGGLQML